MEQRSMSKICASKITRSPSMKSRWGRARSACLSCFGCAEGIKAIHRTRTLRVRRSTRNISSPMRLAEHFHFVGDLFEQFEAAPRNRPRREDDDGRKTVEKDVGG